MPTHRIFRLVLTSGTHPLRRIFILLQDYQGEGWIFPHSQTCQLVVQQGVSQFTPKDTLEHMYCLLQSFRYLEFSYIQVHLVDKTCSASHLSFQPFHTTPVMGNKLVSRFYIMLILQDKSHDLLGGLPFFCGSSIHIQIDFVLMHKGESTSLLLQSYFFFYLRGFQR